jgi:ATP-binding cassette subfamily C (CFTR/MRP) protein 1
MEDLFGGSLKSRQGFSSAYMNEFNSSAFLTDMKAKGSGDPEIVPLSLSIDDWEQQTSSRSIFPALVRSNDFMEVISMASVGRLTSVAKGGFADTTEDEGEPGTSVEMASKMTSAGTLMTKEERKEGDVEWSVYKYYCQAGGWYWAIAFALFALIAQVLQLLGAYWLQWWGTVSIRRKDAGDPLNQERNLYWLEIYIILGCGSIAAYAVRSAALAIHRIGVSELLQKDLLQRSMKAPISFFDTTPLGRILNRFSSDLSTVDEELTQTISSVMNCVVQVLGAVAGVVGATKGTFLVLFAPLGFFYFRLQRYFRVGNTNVARLESVSRSPVYADFSQALAGISSIRAYKDQNRFIQQLEALVNANSIANITQQLFSQWLAVRLDLIGSLISFGIALLAIVAPGFIPAGFVAVGLSYSFQLTTYSRMFVLLSSQYEAQMNSVERIKEYVDTIPKEGLSTELHETQIPKDWPTKGMIEARNISMRYRLDSPLVLKGISFKINSKEKIGVTGRTGSGKSSLMVALFRIQELSEGNLFIDNLDIATIPLDILRKRLGIIPQDPVMFSATIRFNLDPFEEYSDEEIWNALQAVDMKDHIMSLSHRLQEEVSEGGDNLSSGQRQVWMIIV